MNTSDLSLTLRMEPTLRVDRATKTLHDLAIMTAGREAAGHGIYIDQRTIETGLASIQAAGPNLRAAIKHPSLLDRLTGRSDRVLDMPGYFSDVKLTGNKLTAGKFEFFETFQRENPAIVERILEMAEKTPDLFGLSAELCGRPVYVAKDGTEYPAQRDEFGGFVGAPDSIELAYEGMPAIRITRLGVAAFVDQPAANDGLFARLSSLFGGEQKELRALVKEIATAFKTELAEQPSTPSPKGIAPTATADTQPPATDMLSFKDLKTAFGTDKARYEQAVILLAETPELSLAALTAKLDEFFAAAKDRQIAELTAQLATANTAAAAHAATIAALTAERDDFKAKFEAIKTSGLTAQLDLGAPAAGAGAENPWLPETRNFTRQCEILASQPALAAQLKAAAEAAKK